MIKEEQRTVYVTEDNQVFYTKQDAEKHEEELEYYIMASSGLRKLKDACIYYQNHKQCSYGVCPLTELCRDLSGSLASNIDAVLRDFENKSK